MSFNPISFSVASRTIFALLAIVVVLSGCTPPPAKLDVDDPFEWSNRGIHDFNKKLDKALVGPAAKGYVTITPPFLVKRIGTLASYLGLPLQAANNVLQADPNGLSETFLRFSLNSVTLGLFDPATTLGIPDNNADFGQTMYTWRIGPGKYHELPLLGPSTTRDAVGFTVDTLFNPLRFLSSSYFGVGITMTTLDRLGSRQRYSKVIDDTLYNSEDSYTTSRTLYLQNREFFLNKSVNEDNLEDPFAEF